MDLLDSDVLIEAYRTFYSFSLCPGFWDWLDREHGAGRIGSIREVRIEVEARGDDLSRWASARTGTFFQEPTLDTVTAMRTVAAWTATALYTDPARREFLGAADAFLVARGLAYGDTVVTLETPNQPGQVGRIKIPTACTALGVLSEPPFPVFERLGARFVPVMRFRGQAIFDRVT